MNTIDPARVKNFMTGQVAAWNRHDKAGFLALYREMAPEFLDIQYAGRPKQDDGWFVIEEMWDKHNHQIALEVGMTIINGNEAAVQHRNLIVGTDLSIESIETYRFEPGRLHVRYFLKPPASESVDTNQFRGFAATSP